LSHDTMSCACGWLNSTCCCCDLTCWHPHSCCSAILKVACFSNHHSMLGGSYHLVCCNVSQVAYGVCSILTPDTGEAYGVIWTPLSTPGSLQLPLMPGPKPGCFWYKVGSDY
jgi:hypothetical protein